MRSSEKLNRRAATNTEMPNFDSDDEWIDADLVENATALLATVREAATRTAHAMQFAVPRF